jgi:hypothetical protein
MEKNGFMKEFRPESVTEFITHGRGLLIHTLCLLRGNSVHPIGGLYSVGLRKEKEMLARVMTVLGSPDQIEGGVRTFLERIGTNDLQLANQRGALVLFDPKNGKALTITSWKEKRAMNAKTVEAKKVLEELTNLAGESSTGQIEIYEVAMHRMVPSKIDDISAAHLGGTMHSWQEIRRPLIRFWQMIGPAIRPLERLQAKKRSFGFWRPVSYDLVRSKRRTLLRGCMENRRL